MAPAIATIASVCTSACGAAGQYRGLAIHRSSSGFGAARFAPQTLHPRVTQQHARRVTLDIRALAGKRKAKKGGKRGGGKGASPPDDLPLPEYETSAACPCGSGSTYEACCEPFIFGDAQPATCEELMRSRYSAYAKRENKYIISTTHPDHYAQKELSETELIQDVARTAKNCSFHKLAVLNTGEGATPEEGLVEFRTWFKFVQYKGRKAVQGEEWQTLTETSTFKKKDGRWMYVNGETDLTPMPYGDTAPIKPSVEAAAAGKLADLVDKAKELDEQAKAVFGINSIKDGMKTVLGTGKKE